MKNIKFLLTFLVLGLIVFSCREDHTDPVYNGESLLHFNKGAASNNFVAIGSAQKDIEISYGTIKPVTGTHQVKLVLDAAASMNVVEGVDFQILNPTDELTNGETGGTFTVRMMEPANATVAKKAVFKLQSATLGNAVFDNTYTLNWKLQCLVGNFLGTGGFNYTGFWQAPGQYLIEAVPGVPNTLRIIDYPEIGTNFIFTYNDEGIVNFTGQDTGYVYPSAPYAGQHVWIRPNATPSTIDMCARVLTINANFLLDPANAGWINKTEVFTGF
jgi:hypothetical protein